MNVKSVISLALGVLVLAGIAWWLNQQNANDSAAVSAELFPEISADINAINTIRVSDAEGKTVTVVARDDTWRVTEKAGYFADAGKVRALVLALGSARVLEEKTSNPEFYARLGVRDISDVESTAVLLELEGGATKPALLVGNSSSRAGGATLVRRPGESTAKLIAPAIDVDTGILGWLDTRVLDIAADEVQSVIIQGGEEHRVKIAKDAMFDKDFVLDGLADGQTADTYKLNTLGRSLAGLEFENVIRSVAFAIADYSFLNVTYTLFSGVIIDAKVFYRRDEQAENKKYWFAATARFDPNVAQGFVPQPTAGEGIESAPDAVRLTAADIEDRRKQAETITARLEGWMYEIAESRYNSFNYSKADLIKE